MSMKMCCHCLSDGRNPLKSQNKNGEIPDDTKVNSTGHGSNHPEKILKNWA